MDIDRDDIIRVLNRLHASTQLLVEIGLEGHVDAYRQALVDAASALDLDKDEELCPRITAIHAGRTSIDRTAMLNTWRSLGRRI